MPQSVYIFVHRKVRFMEEYYPIRTDWLYTNNMLSVLGLVLEREFGASWENLLTNELLLPLGMNSTTFYDFAAPDYEGFVTPYILNVSSDEPLVLVPGPFDMWRFVDHMHVHLHVYLPIKSLIPKFCHSYRLDFGNTDDLHFALIKFPMVSTLKSNSRAVLEKSCSQPSSSWLGKF